MVVIHRAKNQQHVLWSTTSAAGTLSAAEGTRVLITAEKEEKSTVETIPPRRLWISCWHRFPGFLVDRQGQPALQVHSKHCCPKAISGKLLEILSSSIRPSADRNLTLNYKSGEEEQVAGHCLHKRLSVGKDAVRLGPGCSPPLSQRLLQSWLQQFQQLLSNESWEAVDDGSSVWALPLVWETRMELWVAFGEWIRGWEKNHSLLLPLYIAFQIIL